MANKEEYTQAITQRFLMLKDEVIRDGLCKNAAEFAERVGEHAQNFSKMEKGTRSPTLEHIYRACTEFGYSANWVILNYGPKKTDTTLTVPMEQRITTLELQIRSIKRLLAARSGNK